MPGGVPTLENRANGNGGVAGMITALLIAIEREFPSVQRDDLHVVDRFGGSQFQEELRRSDTARAATLELDFP